MGGVLTHDDLAALRPDLFRGEELELDAGLTRGPPTGLQHQLAVGTQDSTVVVSLIISGQLPAE